MLQMRGVRKSYRGTPALAGVDLEIRQGQVLALLGPNGAGKTTLVSLVAGLLRPDAGTIHVGGADVARNLSTIRQAVGLAPQDLGLYLPLTGRENLSFFGEINGLTGRALTRRIEDLADLFRLEHLLDRPAHAMSGGEQRRVHTAIALIHDPPLLLLDEPTAGVDVETRRAVLSAVRQMAQRGAAICYTTHYMPEVEDLDATVAILDRGRVVAEGSVAELVDSHASSGLELSFDGDPPSPSPRWRSARVGNALHVQTSHPGVDAVAVLSELDGAIDRLRRLEFVRPSLEAVFLSLTGRSWPADEPPAGAPSEAPEHAGLATDATAT
jgi:ABC-2 type transport system ATP-binding protein